MIDLYRPLLSLREGRWFKLICGASYQHLPAVRSLTLAYTLAGADCVDVAADPAIVSIACDAFQVACDLGEEARSRGFHFQGRPWLMVSLNDGEDPHFRKAAFDPIQCPESCPRPCERICPADAIAFPIQSSELLVQSSEWPEAGLSGVLRDRCYGCGRCIPVCPIQHITTQAQTASFEQVAASVLEHIDAIEIHTQVGRTEAFESLWRAIAPFVHRLKLIAISCPDGDGVIDYLRSLYDQMAPLPCALLWQTDGRPMSGDIGKGTTHASIRLAQKVLESGLPGYVQLAGGTNAHTVPKLRQMGLLHADGPLGGVAYGSYARNLLSPALSTLDAMSANDGNAHPIEEIPHLLWQAVELAHRLSAPIKNPAERLPKPLVQPPIRLEEPVAHSPITHSSMTHSPATHPSGTSQNFDCQILY